MGAVRYTRPFNGQFVAFPASDRQVSGTGRMNTAVVWPNWRPGALFGTDEAVLCVVLKFGQ